MDHLMGEKEQNNKDSQKGQVTPKKYLKNEINTEWALQYSLFYFVKNAAIENAMPLLKHLHWVTWILNCLFQCKTKKMEK